MHKIKNISPFKNVSTGHRIQKRTSVKVIQKLKSDELLKPRLPSIKNRLNFNEKPINTIRLTNRVQTMSLSTKKGINQRIPQKTDNSSVFARLGFAK